MRLNSVHVDEFKAIIRLCAGKVCLITAEGDQLIANGILTAVIGLDPIMKVAESQDITIECERSDDQILIDRFIMQYQA